MFEYMWAIWLGVFVIMIIVEASTVELVSMFFALGSLVALIISFIPGVEWWIQLIVFVVISGASLLGLRPLIKKYFSREKRNTNVDEFVGKKVTIVDINGDGYPEAKLNGVLWRVSLEDEEDSIKAGEKAVVIKIEGNRLVVRKEY